MAGFANYGAYSSAVVAGQTSFCSFRKAPSQASFANWWVDLSMGAGNPSANFYANTPLAAATLDGQRGIFHGANQAPSYKYLARLSLQTQSTGLVGVYHLLDYLLYYPFIDGDSADIQTMDNSTTLPRYTDGSGVLAIYVCVAPSSGGGRFTFDYINQDGVQKTSPTQFYNTSPANISLLLTVNPNSNAAYGPFLRLANGDSGIRSIVSVTNTVVNGGLGTIVLVKPLADLAVREINTCCEFSFADQRSPGPRIVDGAYLNLIMNCTSNVASSLLTGFGQFVWG